MKFQEIIANLEQFSASHGGASIPSTDGALVRIDVHQAGEVSLVLWLALPRSNSRSPAFLKPSLTLHCARLSNTPVDDSFLQSLEGVPKEQADSLIAFRRRMNGHVLFPLSGDAPSPGELFAEVGPLSQWTHSRLAEHLTGLLGAVVQLAEQPSWPVKAEEFLAWARVRLSVVPWRARLAESWSVSPEA